MPSKRRKKYKLLLDEGLPLPKSYPTLNNFHDLLHVGQTKYRGKTDKFIYQFAGQQRRIPVVFNTKDFRTLISGQTVSVISLSTNLSDSEADLKIHKALKELKANETKGCLVSITKSGITLNRILGE